MKVSLHYLYSTTLSLFILCQLAFSQDKMNVLFLAVDDLRPQILNADIDHYSTDLMITPNMDRLAERGMVFDRAYCQIPVCSASRLSIMTGTRPYKIRGQNYGRFWTYNDHLDAESPSGAPAGTNHPLDGNGNPAPTIPEIFKLNGYNTQSIGKIYHHPGDDKSSWTEGVTRIKDFKVYNTGTVDNAYEIGIGISDTGYPGGKNRDNGIQALRTLSQKNKPFFLALGFAKPHLPFNCPKKYWDLYDRNDIHLPDNPTAPENAPSQSLHNWGELRGYQNVQYKDASKKVLADDYARTLIHGYYACVSFTDAMIGEVLAELDNLGIRNNTIVVLWGDHGWNLGEHNLWCKHCLYETSLLVPLYIDAPRKQDNLRSNALVEYVDVYPTLCELAGITLPDHLEGTSLVPLLEKPDLPWKNAVYSNWQRGKSLRTDRYRYSEYFNTNDGLVSRMLYDHEADPMETVNIAELSENKVLVETLNKLLNDGWKRAAEGDANTHGIPNRL